MLAQWSQRTVMNRSWSIHTCRNSVGGEELINLAIPELLQRWTKVFDFVTVDESKREAMKYISMMVFLGIDMLTKALLQNHFADVNPHLSAGINSVISDDKAVECTTKNKDESIYQRPLDAARAKNVVDHEETKEVIAIVDGCS